MYKKRRQGLARAEHAMALAINRVQPTDIIHDEPHRRRFRNNRREAYLSPLQISIDIIRINVEASKTLLFVRDPTGP